MNGRGISPIIAVMLLLAITVILAAAVYVTVSNVATVEDNPVYLSAVYSRQGDNWLITVVNVVPTDTTTRRVSFAIVSENATVLLAPTPLSDLPEFQDRDPRGILGSPDYIYISAITYPPGSIAEFVTKSQLIFSLKLRG